MVSSDFPQVVLNMGFEIPADVAWASADGVLAEDE